MQRFVVQLVIIAILFTGLLIIVPPGLGRTVGDVLLHAIATAIVAAIIHSFMSDNNSPEWTVAKFFILTVMGVVWGVAGWYFLHSVMRFVTQIWGQSVQAQFPLYPADSIRLGTAIPVQLLVGMREELVFRGFLQPKLQAASGSATGAIAGTAVLFAAAHLTLGIGVAGFALLGGLLFGAIRHLHNSVLPAAIAHGVYNCLVLILI